METLSAEEIGLRVIGIIAEHFEIDGEKISREMSLHNDLGSDSMDRLGLAVDFEIEFGFSFPDADAASLQTVGQLIDYIAAALVKQAL